MNPFPNLIIILYTDLLLKTNTVDCVARVFHLLCKVPYVNNKIQIKINNIKE